MFDFLLSWHPLIVIFLLSLIYALFTAFVYALFLDVDALREIKKEMDELRKKMSKTKDPKKQEEIASKTLELSLRYNQKTMKSLLFTTIPAIIIFSVILNHYTYEPLKPNLPFNVTLFLKGNYNVTVHEMITENVDLLNVYKNDKIITYELRPRKEGYYNFQFTINNKTYFKDFLVTNLYRVTNNEKKINDEYIDKVVIEYKPLNIVNFTIFGFRPGRLTFYILFSIILSIITRKLFNIP
ncbi:MAG: EMC3/TMCO1 family protein [Candidatus Woesearchaeota archaeon]